MHRLSIEIPSADTVERLHVNGDGIRRITGCITWENDDTARLQIDSSRWHIADCSGDVTVERSRAGDVDTFTMGWSPLIGMRRKGWGWLKVACSDNPALTCAFFLATGDDRIEVVQTENTLVEGRPDAAELLEVVKSRFYRDNIPEPAGFLEVLQQQDLFMEQIDCFLKVLKDAGIDMSAYDRRNQKLQSAMSRLGAWLVSELLDDFRETVKLKNELMMIYRLYRHYLGMLETHNEKVSNLAARPRAFRPNALTGDLEQIVEDYRGYAENAEVVMRDSYKAMEQVFQEFRRLDIAAAQKAAAQAGVFTARESFLKALIWSGNLLPAD
ncbi:MAG: hypothetical protein AB7W16_00105 [Candidatus Obscuribacterales bacterium]